MREPMRRPPVSTVLLSGKYALSLTGEQEQQEKERIHTAETLLFPLFSCLVKYALFFDRRTEATGERAYSYGRNPTVSSVLLSKNYDARAKATPSCFSCSPV